MARTALKLTFNLLLATSFAALDASSAGSPLCPKTIKRSHSILGRFERDGGYARYTPERGRALQAQIESYLKSIGTHLKNYNLEVFAREEMAKIPTVARLSDLEQLALADALRPSFESRKLPAVHVFRKQLARAGFQELPAGKIHRIMKVSFLKWETKLIIDGLGETTWNSLSKSFVEKMKLSELSMEVGLLMKNSWEAFFESEKGPGIFNPSLPGLLLDKLTSTDAHEAVHMTVQALAAEGKESPYHLWIKMNRRFKKSGAIGSRQREALLKADDPLEDGDYYRTELYADEIPAHIIQSSFLSVELSKVLGEEFTKFADSASETKQVYEELQDIYADFLRAEDGAIQWSDYSSESRKLFDSFLERKASDGRTKVAKLVNGMTELMDQIDLISDSILMTVHEAQEILEAELKLAAEKGSSTIHPRENGPISVRKDKFLGVRGYMVEFKIPVAVLKKGEFSRVQQGASAKFRFTNQGDPSLELTNEKLQKLLSQAEWTARMAKRIDLDLDEYTRLLKDGVIRNYSFRDVFALKQVQAKLRRTARETTQEIRDGK